MASSDLLRIQLKHYPCTLYDVMGRELSRPTANRGSNFDGARNVIYGHASEKMCVYVVCQVAWMDVGQ